MKSADALNLQYPCDNVRFEAGQGGLPRCVIANQYSKASMFLQGAHVESFQPSDEMPVLWMSELSQFEQGQPIRGGIPICWPWFGPHFSKPDLPQHGFARISQWNVKSIEENPETTEIVLALESTPESRSLFDYSFDAQYRVSVGQTLKVELTVSNIGTHSMQDVGCAIHSYFSVSNVEAIRVDGLQNVEFIDKLSGSETSEGTPITFGSETDRVYFDPPSKVELIDSGFQRKIAITGIGSRSTVVWNPWIDKSKRMQDFPDEGFRNMVCVETANALKDVRQIEPGETHIISQTIDVQKLV